MFTKDQLIDKSGNFRTQSLFAEISSLPEFVLFTLTEHPKEFNGVTLPSLHTIYMEEADLTEYSLAIRVFGSWTHWEKILQNKKILRHVQRYRDELEVKIRSDAVRALIRTSTEEGSKGTTAAKYVAEKGWDKRKAGAPSKLEVKKEMKIASEMDTELDDDLERIGIRH